MTSSITLSNFTNLFSLLDIGYQNSVEEKLFNIFSDATKFTESQIIENDDDDDIKKDLRRKIKTLSKSDNDLFSLIIHKLIYQENLKITPIEWLTAESLIGLLAYPDDAVFPVTGNNLFKEWKFLFDNNSEEKIKILKFQIEHISLSAKNLIYREVIKWEVGKYEESTFDLFLTFLSFLKEEEVKNFVLNKKDVA